MKFGKQIKSKIWIAIYTTSVFVNIRMIITRNEKGYIVLFSVCLIMVILGLVGEILRNEEDEK